MRLYCVYLHYNYSSDYSGDYNSDNSGDYNSDYRVDNSSDYTIAVTINSMCSRTVTVDGNASQYIFCNQF